MASNYGVPVVIDQEGVVLDVESTAVSTTGGGTSIDKMSPMETMKEVFFEIRDGINYMVDIMAEGLELEKERFRKEGLAGQNKAIVSGNTDPEPKVKPSGGDGDILSALKEALSGIGGAGMGLLGIAGLIAAYFVFNALSDSLAKLLAPILEFLGETLIPNLKELNEIITSHPGGYWALLGATGLVFTLGEVFGIKGSLNKLFTSISKFARTAFIDDIDFRTNIGKTWAGKISRAIYGTKSGKGGLIPGLNRFFTGLGNSIRTTWYPDDALKVIKGLMPQWARSINSGLFGTKAGPPGSGQLAKAGIIGRVGQIFASIGAAIKGIFTAGPVGKALGTIKRITTRFGRVMARIGRIVTNTLGFISKISGLSAFLKLGLAFVKTIPVIGQIVMIVQGIFGYIAGFVKGFKTEGIVGAILGGIMGAYDAVVGSFLNLIFDIVGWVLKKFGLESLGEWFQKADFTIGKFFGAFMSFFNMIAKLGVALAKGAFAAVKAIGLGGESPKEAFTRKFSSVMNEKSDSADEIQAKFEGAKVFSSSSGANDEAAANLQLNKVDTGKALENVTMENMYDNEAIKKQMQTGISMPVTSMTGGATNVSNNSTTTTGFSSTHSDDIAKTLTEIYSE